MKDGAGEPIAIIGMGCRFPGAQSPDEFWQLSRDGVDAITEIPKDRFDIDAHYDPRPGVPGKTSTRWGGFVRNIDRFDADFFGIAPREVEVLDPQQRLLLEVAWEALQDAGVPLEKIAGSNAGVFVGISHFDYSDLQISLGLDPGAYFGTGRSHSLAANRLSYVFDLHGPSLAVDTACSSSLVAAHLACQSLRRSESDLALVGGVNVILTPYPTVAYSQAHMLSSDGRCKAFDASADGYVRSDGCGVIVLKRLSAAARDGDPVAAIIRGTATNEDGRTSGVMVPNARAQEAVIRDALRDAGLQPGDIDYVEAHGTGTPVGDPLEVEALKAVLTQDRPPDRPVIVGSVKTNIGHTETAAGVAGIIRAALILRHREVPPHLHLKELNPAIDLADTALRIVRERTPLEGNGRLLHAGINSFGFGGSNGHVVLEEAPPVAPTGGDEVPRPELLTLSARTPAALDASVEAYRAYLAGLPGAPSIHDVCFTASVRRTHHAERLALVGASVEELIEQLEATRAGESRKSLSRGTAAARAGKLAFVFSGMGTQWHGMGRRLLEEEPVFQDALQRCDAAVARHAGWSVCEEIRADGATSRLGDIGVLQPVLFSIAAALTELWRSWGIEPAGVVGHSVGEIAAAYAAGALSLDEAARVVCARAASLRPAGGKGAMLSVGLSVENVTTILEGYEKTVPVGVDTRPTRTVLSGDQAALREIETRLDGQGVFCRFVRSEIAFHSPQMEPLLAPFRSALSEVQAAEPAVPVYSTVTASVCDGPTHDAAYWLRNLRQPVAFAETIERMLDDGYDTFVEVSPHPVLTHVIQETVNHAGKKGLALPSLRREEDERQAMLQSLGALYAEGHPVTFAALYPDGGRCVTLPLYPWQRERFWIDDRSRDRPRRTGGTGKPLLGEQVASAANNGKLVWEMGIDLSAYPYLADHVVGSSTLFPAAAFAEMALAVAAELGPEPHIVEQLTITQGLVLFADSTATLQIVASADAPGVASLQFLSRGDGDTPGRDEWTAHASATVRSVAPNADETPHAPARPEEMEAALDRFDSAAEHYRDMTLRGLSFGAAFQAVESVHWGDAEAVAHISLPEAAGPAAGYHVHPVVLDACLQTFSALTPLEPYLPVSIARLQVHDAPQFGLWAHARRLTANKYDDEVEGEIRLFNGDGQLVAEILGLRVQRRGAQADDAIEDWMYEMRWEPSPEPQRVAGEVLQTDWRGGWLILAGEDELGGRLASLLEARGLTCTLVFRGESYQRMGPRRFRINPCSRDDCSRILAETTAGQPPLHGVLHLWTQDVQVDSRVTAGFLQEIQVPGTIAALSLVQSLSEVEWATAPQLWLITRGAQPVDRITESGLAQSPLVGFGRVVATELPELRCKRVDLDPTSHPDDADRLLAEMLAGDREDEVAVRDGTRYVRRLVRYRPPSRAGGDVTAVTTVSSETPIRLATSKPGILDNLGFRLRERRPPGTGELEIHVEAMGLNFRDVMSAMGVLPGYPDGLGPLGYECAGVVVAVGEGVSEFQAGDEVVALAYNAFTTYITADARLTVKKPAGVTFEEAVTIPITFLTAQYALGHLARLEAGERVLIHAAAGGVGLAAVQIAQAIGAEIFATAGSPEKREFLRDLGIAHVMDSRSLDFADEIMRVTDGGVDVVLNSIAGEFIPRSLSVLGPYGRFLEIGRRDIYENSLLGLAPFQRNLSFFAIDLDRLFRERPEFVGRMLRQVMAQVESGSLHPLPRTVYPAGEAVGAFRQMAQAKHIGKIVLSFAGVQVPLQVSGDVRFRPDASYLITGGLGGLGLKVARWMAERGAKSLVLVSRRGATPEVEPELASLRNAGCRVTCARVDVAREDEVAGLLHEIERSLPPLRGVIHAAGVIDDATVPGLTRERIERVMAPKVAGAWNLHHLTLHTPLDFFVLFSSLATAFGNGGQGNYAAANQFLDTLAHFRRERGLPALSIAWGPWSEVGMVSSGELLDRLMAGGVMPISPRLGLTAMDHLLQADTAHAVAVPIDWQRRLVSNPGLRTSPFLSHLAQEWTAMTDAAAPSTAGPRDAIATAPPKSRKDAAEAYLREAVAKVMGIAAGRVALEKPLTSLGLDSLMAVELRTRIRLDFDVDVPARAFLDGISIEQMATLILMHLSMDEATGASSMGTEELEEITL